MIWFYIIMYVCMYVQTDHTYPLLIFRWISGARSSVMEVNFAVPGRATSVISSSNPWQSASQAYRTWAISGRRFWPLQTWKSSVSCIRLRIQVGHSKSQLRTLRDMMQWETRSSFGFNDTKKNGSLGLCLRPTEYQGVHLNQTTFHLPNVY
jgi:hypothetical protein